ncbi:MAG: hypothetical protein AAF678_00165 [Pseudomonadota bacterium]
MGFPFETPSWDGVSGAIFMGQASTGVFSVIAIGLCIAALLIGNSLEASKYKKHK